MAARQYLPVTQQNCLDTFLQMLATEVTDQAVVIGQKTQNVAYLRIHGSLELKLGEDMSCSRETKCIAVFYDVCRFPKI